MTDPIVSVVLPFYKNPLVVEAVGSILGQTLRELEVIAIDDCSPNGVADLLSQFNDPRLVLVRRAVNGGASAARNDGIARARGRYIAFMDSDDVSYPDRLRKQLETLERNPGLVGCGTACKYGQKEGAHVLPAAPRQLRWEMLFNSHVIFPTVMARREVVQANPFPGFPASEDYYWMHQIMLAGDFVNLPEVLFHYRMQEGSLSRLQEQAQIQHGNTCRALFAKDIGVECTPQEIQLLEWMGWPRHLCWPSAAELLGAGKLLRRLFEAFQTTHPGDQEAIGVSAATRIRYAATISSNLGPAAYLAWRRATRKLPGNHGQGAALLVKCILNGIRSSVRPKRGD